MKSKKNTRKNIKRRKTLRKKIKKGGEFLQSYCYYNIKPTLDLQKKIKKYNGKEFKEFEKDKENLKSNFYLRLFDSDFVHAEFRPFIHEAFFGLFDYHIYIRYIDKVNDSFKNEENKMKIKNENDANNIQDGDYSTKNIYITFKLKVGIKAKMRSKLEYLSMGDDAKIDENEINSNKIREIVKVCDSNSNMEYNSSQLEAARDYFFKFEYPTLIGKKIDSETTNIFIVFKLMKKEGTKITIDPAYFGYSNNDFLETSGEMKTLEYIFKEGEMKSNMFYTLEDAKQTVKDITKEEVDKKNAEIDESNANIESYNYRSHPPPGSLQSPVLDMAGNLASNTFAAKKEKKIYYPEEEIKEAKKRWMLSIIPVLLLFDKGFAKNGKEDGYLDTCLNGGTDALPCIEKYINKKNYSDYINKETESKNKETESKNKETEGIKEEGI